VSVSPRQGAPWPRVAEQGARRDSGTRRVLLLADDLPNGGMERQLSLLAANIGREWQARVWTMGGGPYLERIRSSAVPVHVVTRRFRLDPSPIVACWKELRRSRPSVVHSWSWMSALIAAPLCLALRIPHIDGMIRSGALEPDHTALKRLGMALSPIVISNTAAGLDAWGIGTRKGRVVPNGFDFTRVPSSGERKVEDGPGLVVVMSARMTPVKDFSLLIAVARRLGRGEAGWRFVLVGDGPERPRLMAQAADLIAAGVVEFPDPGMEILDIVAGADLGVLLTDVSHGQEGLSNSILEYMALGLPVVCSDAGGNREAVDDGVTGLVVPPGDADALCGALAYLRSHAPDRLSMGRAGRARVEREFSVAAMVRNMTRVYEEAVARTRPVSRGGS